MYLPDSNVVIRAIQGHEIESLFLRYHIRKRTLVLSVVAIAEFLVKATDEEKERFDELVEEFGALVIDEKVARIAGEYRKQLLRKTKKTFLTDCFLAAQAKVHDLTLVTNNKADFPMEDIKIVAP